MTKQAQPCPCDSVPGEHQCTNSQAFSLVQWLQQVHSPRSWFVNISMLPSQHHGNKNLRQTYQTTTSIARQSRIIYVMVKKSHVSANIYIYIHIIDNVYIWYHYHLMVPFHPTITLGQTFTKLSTSIWQITICLGENITMINYRSLCSMAMLVYHSWMSISTIDPHDQLSIINNQNHDL